MISISPKVFDPMRKAMTEFPKAAQRAQVLAVNEGARYGRAEGSRQIVQEVAFKKSYVSKNLFVKQKATGETMEAVIEGRFRPTSLAEFATSPRKFGKQRGVRVRVSAKGGAKRLGRGFFVRLRRGNTGELGNVGLAVRLKPGERLQNKRNAALLRNDKHGSLYLLYGPSVNQVFFDVREKITPKVLDRVEKEFLRQFARLTRG